jgi:methylthioribose-1-phosphate isomerase
MKIFNPAFDVTSQELISAIITEKGVITPPFERNIRTHMATTPDPAEDSRQRRHRR